MKKLFALVAVAGLGLATIGCSEKKPAASPPATPEHKEGAAGAEGSATPAPEGGATPAPTEGAAPTEGKTP